MKRNQKRWTSAVFHKFSIQNYLVNPDESIDVDGDVDFYKNGLIQLSLKFSKVSGDFDCRKNQFTSLDVCPKSVGNLYCSNNKLTSLDGVPESISGSFNCGCNKLTSLDG